MPDNVVVFVVGKVVALLLTPVMMLSTNRLIPRFALFWVPNELTLNDEPATVVPFARDGAA